MKYRIILAILLSFHHVVNGQLPVALKTNPTTGAISGNAYNAATFRSANGIGTGSGDVTAAGNNNFTGANTFTRSTGSSVVITQTGTGAENGLLINALDPSFDGFGIQVNTDDSVLEVSKTTIAFSVGSIELLVDSSGVSASSNVIIGANSGLTGDLIFKGTTSGTVTLTVNDAAGTYTLVLPNSDGDADQLLKTDGSGNLSWATVGALTDGDKGNITVSSSGTVWTIDNGVVTNAKLATGLAAARIAATWADVYATAADRDGQIGVSNDGSVGVFRDGVGGTNQQKWESDVVWKPGINYFNTVNVGTNLVQSGGSYSSRSIVVQSGFNILVNDGTLSVTTTSTTGPSATFESGNTVSASPWTFRNTAASGLTNTDWLQSDSIGGVTVGTGNASAGAVYARRGVIETFFGLAGGTSGKAMPLDFRQFGEYSGNDEGHVMLTLDSDAGVTIFGYTAATERALQRVLVTPEAHVRIGGGATASQLQLLEPSGSGTNKATFKAQAMAADTDYTLPPDDGDANEVLTTNGSGSLTWEAGSVVNNGIAAGRLTLTSGTPVLTTTVSAAGTLYFTPYNGNRIALYDGSAWNVRTFSQITKTLSELDASTAYDVYAYDNAGTVTLEYTAWTNVTTRATALAFQDGVYVKTGDATRRYIGSIVLDASEQMNVIFGGSADGGTAGKCDLWNMNNRVPFMAITRDTTNSWAWATTSWQQANASAGNQVTMMLGLATVVRAQYATTSGGTTNIRYAGIGLDATNALASGATSFAQPPGGSAAAGAGHMANFLDMIAVGQHYLAAIEYGNGSVTFYGDNNTSQLRSGLTVMSEY